ncbi:SDR family NAD(P)-dependent oxidoreductase [Spirillospora sp. CA-294931]|uniref:type I polyketide synthase n=1 Tax=Spirillospora sp. CA-294931 TaxID=3240042 RepID=UPI003D8A36DF
MTLPHTGDLPDDLSADDEPAVEPIAVVGLACRFPGAPDARRFWRNLADGVDSITFSTIEEQRALGVQERFLKDPNFVPAAMLLEEHDSFDAGFFKMSQREAEIRDPQHRMFLELAYTALEDAGYDPARYPGEIGVYAGVGPDSYQWLNIRSNPQAYSTAGWLTVMVGSHVDYAATLTSYKLDLRGPAFTVQTACSTGLVAAHVACESLRNGECDMALTGSAMIEEQIGHGYVYDQDGVVSPDGHCRAFDAKGQGTVWGSGGGVVVLKRLQDAIDDGDDIRAVILGNALNNDGANKVGFSAPSQEGQATCIAQALGVAGVDPRTVTYVEAHGTGTALGDPIEVAALTSVFQQDTDDRGWCALGSVKSNIGHLGQAAGAASLIKTVLTVEKGLIPKSLHYESPNPKIDFGKNPFYVNDSLSKWETDGFPRRAGVSSFGIGGTNAHLVLQEAPERPPLFAQPRPAHLVRLSARTDTALRAQVDRLGEHLSERSTLDLSDVAYTLRVGRREMARRAVVVAEDTADAIVALTDPKRLITGAVPRTVSRVALLFSGQGSQYPGMGGELYEHEPVFQEAVDECVALLREELDVDLADLIFTSGDADRLRRTEFAQPALFVIEYALAKLWSSWGLEPAAMIGHSIGEYVAATLAGVFTLPGALRLVAARGRLMQRMPSGSMLMVQLEEPDVRSRMPAGLSVATVNAPGTCVVAGPGELVDAWAEELGADGIGCTALHTSHAFHSAMMDPILAEFRELVAATELAAPGLPFLSNLTGTWITAAEATDPSYWVRHLRETVRFGDCVTTLLGEGDWLLVECGPGSQLAQLAGAQLAGDAVRPVPSLPGPRDTGSALTALYSAAGTLWVHGIALADFGAPGRRVQLPTYPWERKRAWMDPVGPFGHAPLEPATPEGPLAVEDWFSVPVWRQLPPSPAPAPALGRCLVFADDASADLVPVLRAAGAEVVVVRPGDGYERVASDAYTVRSAERADYDALIGDLTEAGGPPGRIVHAWTVGAPPAGTDARAVWDAQERGFFALLNLVQALTAQPSEDPVRLEILTAATQDVTGGDLLRPEHATVTGITRVVPLEVPWLDVRQVDLDDRPDWAAAVDELGRDAGEDGAGLHPALAHRAGRRWVREYEPVRVPESQAPALRDQGVHVITGGLGGIGITLAEDLATRVRARLVLLSRGGLPPREQWDAHLAEHGTGGRTGRAIAAVRRMEAAGAEVLVLAADVTSAGDLRRVREETLRRFGRVDGIVHAAGLPGGGMAEVKERAAAEEVLASKLLGTLALHEAFGDLDLDSVVLCSSITAVTGGFGQVDYCAANGFMDAYARGAHGWRARVTSVDWGAWLEVGMAAEVSAPEAFRTLQRGEAPAGTVTPIDHPLLTERHDDPGGGLPWCSGNLSPATAWPLDEHRLGQVPVLPGTGHLETARAAAEAALPGRADGQVIELSDVTFIDPIVVHDGTSCELSVSFSPDSTGDLVEFTLATRADGPRRTHTQGSVRWVDPGPAPVADLDAIRSRCAHVGGHGGVPLTGLLAVGPHWDTMQTWYTGDNEALALLELSGVALTDSDRWDLHPSMLDEATSFVRFSVDGHYLPLSYGRVVVRAPMPDRVWSHLRFRESGTAEVLVADISLVDDEGREVVGISDFTLRRINPDAVLGTVRSETPAPTVAAAPAEPSAPAPAEETGLSSGGGTTPDTPRNEEVRGIRPADGAEAFRRLLAARLGPQAVVTAVPLTESFAGVRALTQETVETELSGPALADPAAARPASEDYVAPRTELEATIARLFAEVLGGEGIGIEDDFFELGGNSLVAVQLLALVRKQLGARLPMRSLFEEPTAAGIAVLVEQARQETGGDDEAPPEQPAPTTIPRLPRRAN